MNALRVAWAVLAKDARAELRSKEAVTSMVVFGVLTIVVMNFAFEPTLDETMRIAPGVLWIAFAFAGILGLNRSFAMEREAGAITGLMLAPVDRGAIYVGKVIANTLFIVVLQAVVLPLFAVFYNVSLFGRLGRLVPVALLGALAFSAAGTAFAAVAANTTMREVMTPLLLFPAATPVLISATEATGMVLLGELEGYGSALKLLAGFTILYGTASVLLFDYVLEE